MSLKSVIIELRARKSFLLIFTWNVFIKPKNVDLKLGELLCYINRKYSIRNFLCTCSIVWSHDLKWRISNNLTFPLLLYSYSPIFTGSFAIYFFFLPVSCLSFSHFRFKVMKAWRTIERLYFTSSIVYFFTFSFFPSSITLVAFPHLFYRIFSLRCLFRILKIHKVLVEPNS